MKVYVVKNPQGKYLTEMMDFADELIFANLFVDVESAWAYAPNDCRAVECFLMERDERVDYTKQVRKEVVQEIKDLAGDYFEFHWCEECGETDSSDVFLRGKDLTEILDQLQGENKSGN